MQMIEVIQDGAAVVDKSSQSGIYTESIATCIVYAFYGENGFSLVHDTGQLAISSIVETVRRCGKIRKAFLVENQSLATKHQAAEHRRRRARILAALSVTSIPTKLSTISGQAFFTGDLEYGTELSEISSQLSSIPYRAERLCINELNNLFSQPNSQSLPIDLQFVDGNYTELPPLLLPPSQMWRRAAIERRNGDSDYLSYLQKAVGLGVLAGGA